MDLAESSRGSKKAKLPSSRSKHGNHTSNLSLSVSRASSKQSCKKGHFNETTGGLPSPDVPALSKSSKSRKAKGGTSTTESPAPTRELMVVSLTSEEADLLAQMRSTPFRPDGGALAEQQQGMTKTEDSCSFEKAETCACVVNTQVRKDLHRAEWSIEGTGFSFAEEQQSSKEPAKRNSTTNRTASAWQQGDEEYERSVDAIPEETESCSEVSGWTMTSEWTNSILCGLRPPRVGFMT
jgi:hypothetical protein